MTDITSRAACNAKHFITAGKINSDVSVKGRNYLSMEQNWIPNNLPKIELPESVFYENFTLLFHVSSFVCSNAKIVANFDRATLNFHIFG